MLAEEADREWCMKSFSSSVVESSIVLVDSLTDVVPPVDPRTSKRPLRPMTMLEEFSTPFSYLAGGSVSIKVFSAW